MISHFRSFLLIHSWPNRLRRLIAQNDDDDNFSQNYASSKPPLVVSRYLLTSESISFSYRCLLVTEIWKLWKKCLSISFQVLTTITENVAGLSCVTCIGFQDCVSPRRTVGTFSRLCSPYEPYCLVSEPFFKVISTLGRTCSVLNCNYLSFSEIRRSCARSCDPRLRQILLGRVESSAYFLLHNGQLQLGSKFPGSLKTPAHGRLLRHLHFVSQLDVWLISSLVFIWIRIFNFYSKNKSTQPS